MSINARSDEARAGKPQNPKSSLGVATDVAKPLSGVAQKERREGATTKALLASDFVGCADGPEDLSSCYKRHLTRALESKHGAR